jgi:PIN domain nuclease of toxin-antitoxin system
MIYLDTNVLVKLDARDMGWFSKAARRAIDRNEPMASPAVVLELDLLHEIGRLKPSARKLLEGLADEIGLRICDLPFRTVVEHSREEGWSRDPFDRLIVGNAKAANASLVTKDQRILRNYPRAIW